MLTPVHSRWTELNKSPHILRIPKLIPAESSSLLHTEHSRPRSYQMLVDTALERAEAELSDAVSTSTWKSRSGKWLVFKSELEPAGIGRGFLTWKMRFSGRISSRSAGGACFENEVDLFNTTTTTSAVSTRLQCGTMECPGTLRSQYLKQLVTCPPASRSELPTPRAPVSSK